MYASQVIVMFARTRIDSLANTPSHSGSQPQAFNSAGMMTRSQLAASARTPWTPSRGLPITGRTIVASPIIFHHEDSPYRVTITVNVTSASQGLETTISGVRGSQDRPADPSTSMKNVDIKDYHFDSEGEHTAMAEWRAQVES